MSRTKMNRTKIVWPSRTKSSRIKIGEDLWTLDGGGLQFKCKTVRAEQKWVEQKLGGQAEQKWAEQKWVEQEILGSPVEQKSVE